MAFEELLEKTRGAFTQNRVFEKAKTLAIGNILAFGRHTITGMLCAVEKQFADWSATYRIFEKERVSLKLLFRPIVETVLEHTCKDQPLTVMMDDTIIRKRGRKVSGASWRRDPLGPAFRTNFVWGQRYLQISAALPDQETTGRARGIPLDFYHAPSVKKPSKKAPPEAWAAYKDQKKLHKLSKMGADRLAQLRAQVPDRKIICAIDGGYTNREVFCNIPENTVLIGRIRKDARLFKVPDQSDGNCRGRKKYYGDSLPTPEEIRQDETVPWQKVKAFAAGKSHEFQVKAMKPVRWKSSKNKDVLVMIVRPLAYRPRKGASLLYRDPAYLICTDPALPLEQIIQSYVWRWETEINFRDEKTVLGVGEAQVRTESAVKTVPAFCVAIYSMLLLAAHIAKVDSSCLPDAKWNKASPNMRPSTQKIVSHFRASYWNIDPNKKSGFVSPLSDRLESLQTRLFPSQALSSACCYALK